MLQQHTLRPNKKATHRKKIFGRGNGSGHGSFSGRGCKGQLARAGHSKVPGWFEGGQTSIVQKLPKARGFKRTNKKSFFPVNISALEILDNNTVVTTDVLFDKKIISKKKMLVKILGDGKLTKKLTVTLSCSQSAKTKIEQAGGTVEAPVQKEEKSKKPN